MLDGRRLLWRNPAFWYAWLGVVSLGASLWLPWATAARTARIEQRADRLAEAIAATVRETGLPKNESDRTVLFARLLRRAAANGVFAGDIEPVATLPAGVAFLCTNKHYAFQVAASPLPDRERASPDAEPTPEVIAWPLSSVGPGHCAFFHPGDGVRAYSRNLTKSYAGFDRRPAPGAGQRRQSSTNEGGSSYRGEDEERWLHH